MKKFLLSAMALLLAALVSADEGMWLLPLLQKMNIKTMQEMGCELSADDIYNINHASLKDAVVMFGGGCTGEIISASGLLVTNHHCGYGAIQKLSSVEHNYLEDGYWAMDRSQELPAQGLSVTFLESFTDVTKQIEKAEKKAKTDQEREKLHNDAVKEICDKAVRGKDYLSARVYSMYSENSWYLVVTKTYRDVRFVGAPPSSIGKFGADTDNWMWPRHTCDFSMFRVYAGPDNEPAAYSPDNVPYISKRHLAISLKGVEEGDFAFIMGYPGRTNRYMTESELRETIMTNDISIRARTVRQDVLMEDMLADPKVKIQYASKYSGSSNGWKKYIGMNETFEKLNVPQRRADLEKAFTGWISSDKKRTAEYGGTLDKINSSIAGRREAISTYYKINETVGRSEIAAVPVLIKRSKAANIERSLDSFYKDYSVSTDRKVTKAMMKHLKQTASAEELPGIFADVDTYFAGDIDAYVDNMFDNSVFVDRDRAVEFAKRYLTEPQDPEVAVQMEKDPATGYVNSINSALPALVTEINSFSKPLAEGKKEYTRAQLKMCPDEAIYPDANMTMRLTYGKVLSYSPKDAVIYKHYTTLDGVMEKEDPDNWEFVVPEKLKDLYKAKDYGQYARKDGRMPACFLTNCDITGGNSGSPVLNAKGQLIGLAFDGNWEAMSGDIIFEPSLQRCINVDIRYVLFIVDKFGGAGYLLDEMTIEK